MAERLNIYDIASMANVSTTTVYKVMHGKKGVSETTRRNILDIIEKHGYKANFIAQSLARNCIKIGVIIESYCSDFCEEVFNGVKDTIQGFEDSNVEALFGTLETSYSKERIISDLEKLVHEKVDGIVLFPYVPYREYIDIIDDLQSRGIPVAVVAINLPESDPLITVCHNYELVGELGAELLGLYSPKGKNALFIGNKDVAGHKEIIQSFERKTNSLGSEFLAVYETQDDDNVGYYLTEKLFRDYPEVNGIFVGTTQSSGICKKVVESGRNEEIKIVCVDTYPRIIENIKKGVIQATIFQNPYLQGKLAVKNLIEYIISKRLPQKQILINPRIVLNSNCEGYKDYIIR